ncbi:MAG: VTT domain-containing protein [Microgenomates group bacterium]
MVKIHKRSIFFISLIVVLSVVGYSWLINQPFSQQIGWFAQTHRYLLIGILVGVKVLGLVWPPLPGGIFNLAVIPFIGWQLAYLSDLIGTIMGAGICYLVAKRWGDKLLTKIFDEETVKKITDTKVKGNRQTEFSFVMTITSRLIMTEFSYYAAGLLKINFGKFIVGAIGSHILLGIPSYYFMNIMFETNTLYLGIVGWLIVIPLWSKIKERYLERGNV